MTLRLLVACEDAGGAAALAPIVRELRGRGDELSFLLGPVAARRFQSEGLAATEAIATGDGVRQRLSATRFTETSALLTATTCWGLRLEAQAVVAARAASRPSLGVIDFWSNYRSRLSYPGSDNLAALPDRVAVVDDLMRDDLEQAGVQPSRIFVTGGPAFDEIVARGRYWKGGSRTVLFLSQPIEDIYGSGLGYTERTVLSALSEIVAETSARLVVRPHPRERVTHLVELVEALQCDAEVDGAHTLVDAISTAAVVVGMTSVALIEAALAGAPVVSAQINRRGEDVLPTNRSGLTVGVGEIRVLRDTVLLALRSPEVFLTRTRGAADTFGVAATARVVECLDDLISKWRVP